ncbi:nitrilase-related carbon-nitrogen hydrolase [Amycolatopsis sp. CA-126428]|uniref:nitrilase-related carbon-nitrogen hydrolase n=1 Tax=Amycolatopsis sp. CA-126428 TaxID=2073158 RepID=UPI0018EC74FE|nr:nitrilase-related carbon-nitrogen hydrolase [Amycolatopsis sp. CA-126428]
MSALFSVGNGFPESRTWLPARALDNTVHVLPANHTGATGGWTACGGSAVWGPDGRVQACPGDTTVVTAYLDPDRLSAARSVEPLFADLAAPAPEALRRRDSVRA